MRVLLTGASGFVGRRLLAQLEGCGHEVIALARTPLDGIETVVADLAAGSLELPHVDAVVHLAQSRRYREFPDGAADMVAVNVHATFALLDHARRTGASHFVYASTGAVYAPSFRPLREDDAVGPVGFYPRSKLAGELLVEGYADDLVTVILRPFAIYGEGQQGMLLANLAARILADDEVVVQGSPGLRINPVHVDDAARAFAAALQLQRSDVVNVAGDVAVTLPELAEMLADLGGREARVRHAEGDSSSLVADTSRMRDVLGVTPQMALRDGLAGLVSGLADRAQ